MKLIDLFTVFLTHFFFLTPLRWSPPSQDKLMHSWGFALREGVFAKPKEIYIKIQEEREEGAMKRAGPAASWSYRAPEHRDYDTPSL